MNMDHAARPILTNACAEFDQAFEPIVYIVVESQEGPSLVLRQTSKADWSVGSKPGGAKFSADIYDGDTIIEHVASFVTGGGVMEATWAVLVAEFLQR